MKILHIGDQAGVGCILAKYQKAKGDDSFVVIPAKNDKYGIYNYYRKHVLQIVEQEFLQSCVRLAAEAQLVHVHSSADVLIHLRKQLGPSKKILIHFHGTDLRGIRKIDLPHRSVASDLLILAKRLKRQTIRHLTWNHTLSLVTKLADAVMVATPDLQGCVPNAIYLPNPVDRDLFRPCNPARVQDKGKHSQTLTIKSEALDIDRTIRDCSNHGINVEVHDRTKSPVQYADMPAYLNEFSQYVDIRYVNGHLLENLSKTGLEALSCGIEVIDYRFRSHRRLPPQHEPQNAVSTLDRIYNLILQAKEQSSETCVRGLAN